MRILWFEISIPGKYKEASLPTMGWQDSLEYYLKKNNNIELAVSFEASKDSVYKEVEGVKYYPLGIELSKVEQLRARSNRWIKANKLTPLAIKVIEDYKPDIIHVFGTEWSFGQVAAFTKIPVVIHMQGCIAPYNNSLYPPNYSSLDDIIHAGFNLKKQWHLWNKRKDVKSWQTLEESNFKLVENYMGRTEWDRLLVNHFHPGAKYYYCSEALRPDFTECKAEWKLKKDKKIRLITVGSSSHWKGMDTVLKTAKLLKNKGVEFEWTIAGNMPTKSIIEKKERTLFSENNVKILGFTNSDTLVTHLLAADFYIHTAYIDNSPNSLCEAQYLGLPIIATYVGGVPSLINNGNDGMLIPANAPYTLAETIIELKEDFKRQVFFSKNALIRARERHNPDTIIEDLLHCYKNLIKNSLLSK